MPFSVYKSVSIITFTSVLLVGYGCKDDNSQKIAHKNDVISVEVEPKEQSASVDSNHIQPKRNIREVTTVSDTSESEEKGKAISTSLSGKNGIIEEQSKDKERNGKNSMRSSKINFEKIRFDFDTISQGDTVDYKFVFTNVGSGPLEIKSASATCGCTQPSYPFIGIEPGENGFIGVRYVSVSKEGDQKPLITVKTNDIMNPEITLMMSGYVMPPPSKERFKKDTDNQNVESDSIKKMQSDTIK